jgi:hypothetical protein
MGMQGCLRCELPGAVNQGVGDGNDSGPVQRR